MAFFVAEQRFAPMSCVLLPKTCSFPNSTKARALLDSWMGTNQVAGGASQMTVRPLAIGRLHGLVEAPHILQGR